MNISNPPNFVAGAVTIWQNNTRTLTGLGGAMQTVTTTALALTAAAAFAFTGVNGISNLIMLSCNVPAGGGAQIGQYDGTVFVILLTIGANGSGGVLGMTGPNNVQRIVNSAGATSLTYFYSGYGLVD